MVLGYVSLSVCLTLTLSLSLSLNGPWVCWVFARESEIVRESVCACVRERVSLSMCVFLCVSLCVSLSLTLSLSSMTSHTRNTPAHSRLCWNVGVLVAEEV